MVKKIKSPSCNKGWCQNHVFQLNPLRSNLYFLKNINIRLCPQYNKTYNTFDNALPQINKDKKYYTPFFILQDQKKFYIDHDQRARISHQKLQNRQLQDESHFTIYAAKHGRDNPYCSVCQKKYTDYLQHIESNHHKVELQKCVFTRYIIQIQQNLKQKQNKQNQSDAHKNILNIENIRSNDLINNFKKVESAQNQETKAQIIPQDNHTTSLININNKIHADQSHLDSFFHQGTKIKQIQQNVQ